MTSISINRQDGLSSATAWKGPVRVATTTNIQLSDLQVIDGELLDAGDRVLVKDQTDARYNGIWVVDTGLWRRARDFASNRDVREGTQVFVVEGATYNRSGWYVSSDDPIQIGTTDIQFTQNMLINTEQLEQLVQQAEAARDAAQAAEDAANSVLDSMLERSVGSFASDTLADQFLVDNGLSKFPGTIYFNTTGSVWKYWDGTGWQAFPYATVADGSITKSKLDESLIERLSGSGVLDVRDVYRSDDVTFRGSASINSGSNQLSFSGLTLKAGDYVWVSGAQGTLTTYSVKFDVVASPLQNRILYLVADGFIFNSNHASGGVPVLTTDTPTQVADKIRAGSWSGWTVSGTGASVTFTRNKAGATLGVHWSDVDFAVVPKNETVLSEGSGAMLAKVVSVSGNVATLDDVATNTVTNNICYREIGRPVRLAMAANSQIKTVLMPQGEFFISDGLVFGMDGGAFIGAGPARTTLYALPPMPGQPSWVIDFRSSASNGALYGIECSNFTLRLQNVRRNGVRTCRLWDGSNIEDVLIYEVAKGYIGMRNGAHPDNPTAVSDNDQSVVSQSITMRNVHVLRTNPSQDDATPVWYQEYIQEGAYRGCKVGSGTDTNGHGVTIGMQIEASRGLKFDGCSFSMSKDGLKITAITGHCEGIVLDGASALETNTNAVHCFGGGYAIEDVRVVGPRIIGSGNAFVIARCSRGVFETQDRVVSIGTGQRKNTIITDNPALVTDADGLGANTIISSSRATDNKYYLNNVFGHVFAMGGYSAMSLELPAEDTQSSLFLLISQGGSFTVKRVLQGPVDSGQSGFRMLRVLN